MGLLFLQEPARRIEWAATEDCLILRIKCYGIYKCAKNCEIFINVAARHSLYKTFQCWLELANLYSLRLDKIDKKCMIREQFMSALCLRRLNTTRERVISVYVQTTRHNSILIVCTEMNLPFQWPEPVSDDEDVIDDRQLLMRLLAKAFSNI
jgi:hypothetical protein